MKGENKRRVNICYVQYVSKLYNTLSCGWKVYTAAETELEYSSHSRDVGSSLGVEQSLGTERLIVFPLTVAKKMSTFLCREVVFFFFSMLLNDLHALESKGKQLITWYWHLMLT